VISPSKNPLYCREFARRDSIDEARPVDDGAASCECEELRLIRIFCEEIEKAADDTTFESFSVFAKDIARRIDVHWKLRESRRVNGARMCECLNDERRMLRRRKLSQENFKGFTRCSFCHENLKRIGAWIFPCGHFLHDGCKKRLDLEIEQMASSRNAGYTDECPLCGVLAPLRINLPLLDKKHRVAWPLDGL
jgi:hypothetical protein